ncbi:37S ribosomal protein S16, mitochondrial [Arachnomyces sp. PD_36]|nr:37S ribosomal protein S16, mitochondrial [Arachnomyces sp. PD_36]
MVVKLRLARFGNRHSPIYNIVVAQARTARDSKPMEVIGTYNPIPQKPTNLSQQEAKTAKPYKDIVLDRSRAKYWLGVGAQPSEPVWRLLSLVGLIEPKPGHKDVKPAPSQNVPAGR